MSATEDPLEELLGDALASGRTAAQALRALTARIEAREPGCILTLRVAADGGAVTRTFHSSNDARDLSTAWFAARADSGEAVAGAVLLEELTGASWEILLGRARRAGVAAVYTAEVSVAAGEACGEALVFASAAAHLRAADLAARLADLAGVALSRPLPPPPEVSRPDANGQQELFASEGGAMFKPMTRRAAAAPPPKMARSKPRAIVVEDEPAVGELIQRVVAAEGYAVELVLDPAEALRTLAAEPAARSLLLLDLTLPGIDGGELARRARRLGVTSRIVVVSGLGERHARSACVGADVDAFVSKPFTPAQLRAAMGAARSEADAV